MGGRGRQSWLWIARSLALAAACLVLPAGRVQAGDVPGIEQIRFRTYTTAQGLPQATARVLAQSATGFLWVGTQDGLARFDGYSFKTYKHDRKDPWSLSDGHVSALLADPAGGLWIGTMSGGLNRYDSDLDRFTVYRADPGRADALASNNVTALLLDRNHRLWVASTGARLQWFDRTTGTLHDSGLGEQPVLHLLRSMIELRDGSLLLGTLDGLWRFDTKAMTLREVRAGNEASLDVYALAQGEDGELWAGTADHGLYRFDAGGALLAHYLSAANGDPGTTLHDNSVRALLFDREGMLWIAGNVHGLARMDTSRSRFTRYAHDPARPESVAANRLWCLFEDRHGLLVVGSWVNGISINDPRTRAFTQIDSVPGDPRTLPARPSITVHADADGTLWAGVIEGGGLVHLDLQRGVTERFNHDPARATSLAHDFVQFVTSSHDGSLWVATGGGGLDRMRPGTREFEHTRHDPDNPASLASDTLLTFYEDREGTQWVGTVDRGLDERCAGCSGFRHHHHDSSDPYSISDNAVPSVLETRAGDLWIATRLGLDRYDRASGRFEHFRARIDDPTSISSDSIMSLMEDRHGDLWVGTQGGGLNHRLVDKAGRSHFEVIGSHEGLAADAIGAMMEDPRGDIWVSTTVGISRIGANNHDVANFGAHDGAQELGYWVDAVTRLADQRIAFGGLGGITIVDTQAVKPPPEPEPVITSLLLQNVPTQLHWQDPHSPLERNLWRGGRVTLTHDQSNVTFEFSALAFSDPESIHYAYRLDGHDKQWIETPSSRRLATYTDLAPGRYTLRVRARHDGSIWGADAPEAVVGLQVQPAPWASPRAYLVYALAALALVLLASLQMRITLRRRRAVQEAIRLSEERLKLALWGSGSELWDIDLVTGHMHRENQLDHLAATHEVPVQHFEGYRPFVHPDDIARVDHEMREHFEGRTPVFEASYRTPNRAHEWVWLLTRGRVVERDAAGHATRMSGTNSDINALRQALDALRVLNEQLESRVEQRTEALQGTLDRLTLAQRQLFEAEKLASLGGMVAGIAHEINTPLGIGVTAASHLQEQALRMSRLFDAGTLGPADLEQFQGIARECCDLILRNLQRADRLVKSFKQVAIDQSSEDRRVIDIGASINEILTTLGPSLRKTPYRVEVDCPPGLLVETAPGALYQIITNLVMNSLIHAFEPETTGRIRIEVRRHFDLIQLDYHDDGRGMDEAVRARIFEPFYTTRRGQGGSGLGMHIVYSLVTQVLHGQIDCDSEAQRGTHFRIRFEARFMQRAEPATCPEKSA